MEDHKEHLPGFVQTMPDEDLLIDLAELYKVFGDSTRIKILYTLFEEEKGVGDIAGHLNMTMSAISIIRKLINPTIFMDSCIY